MKAANAPKGSASVHLDALRGFAAFSVLLFHWRKTLFVEYKAFGHHSLLCKAGYFISSFGHQWVIVFFVLSGYLVGGSVMRALDTGRWSWRSYLLTRLTRLYVVLLPALLLGGFCDWFRMYLNGMLGDINDIAIKLTFSKNVFNPLSPAILSPASLFANCLFLQRIRLPGQHYEIPVFGSNGPLWSLANEFWYYMAFPLLALMLARGRSWWMRAGCGLGLLIWGWFVGQPIVLLGIPWLMGVLIVYLPAFPARGLWARRIAIGMALGLFAVALPVDIKIASTDHIWVTDTLLGLIVTLLIWVLLHCAVQPLPSLYIRIAQRSAHSSYTLYLTHYPMMLLLIVLLHMPRVLPGWHGFFVNSVLLALVILYAQVVYELFEKQTGRVRAWIKPYILRTNAA
jgi:peptidoglycan/LPS O-acetylase OafA/YrhL